MVVWSVVPSLLESRALGCQAVVGVVGVGGGLVDGAVVALVDGFGEPVSDEVVDEVFGLVEVVLVAVDGLVGEPTEVVVGPGGDGVGHSGALLALAKLNPFGFQICVNLINLCTVISKIIPFISVLVLLPKMFKE